MVKNIRLLPKLLGGFAIVAVIVVVVGWFGLTGIARLKAQLDAVGKRQLPASTSIQTLKYAMVEIHAAENILLVEGISEQDRAAAYSQFIDAQQSAENARAVYGPIAKATEEAALWDQFKAAWDAWWKEHESFVQREKAYRTAPSSLLYRALTSDALATEAAVFDAALQILSADAELQGGYAAGAVQAGDEVSFEVRRIAEVGLIAGPLLALLFSFLLTFSITRPLARGIFFAERMAAGDFNRKILVDRRDEVGKLCGALNLVGDELRGMVVAIQERAEQVASSSEEISATSIHLAEGAQGQALSLEETGASVEALSGSVDQVFEHCRLQAAAVEQASHSMEDMQKSIQEVSRNLNEIAGLARHIRREGRCGCGSSSPCCGRDRPDLPGFVRDRGNRHSDRRHSRSDEPSCLERGH